MPCPSSSNSSRRHLLLLLLVHVLSRTRQAARAAANASSLLLQRQQLLGRIRVGMLSLLVLLLQHVPSMAGVLGNSRSCPVYESRRALRGRNREKGTRERERACS